MERSKVASREKTKEVYEAADKLGLSWPLDDDITNAELEEMLFSGLTALRVSYSVTPNNSATRARAEYEITAEQKAEIERARANNKDKKVEYRL